MSIEPLLINPSRMGQAAQAVKSLAQSNARLAAPTNLSAGLASTLPTEASSLGVQTRPSMGLGKAALAMVAGLLLFFVMGPRALKFAAKGAGVLGKALLNPQALAGLVNKGLMFFAMLEAALPIVRNLGLGQFKMPTQLTALARQFGSTPAGTQALGAGASTAATAIPNFVNAATQALPRAGEFAGNLLRQSPPVVQQHAQNFLSRLAAVINTLKNSAPTHLPKAAEVINPNVIKAVV